MHEVLVKQTHPPTAVDYSLHAHFTGQKDDNLILVKGNRLEIYTVRNVSEKRVSFLYIYKKYIY